MTLPVSVIVVNHNGRKHLRRCLESIVRAAPTEILLVDSGSTDGSAHDAARRFPLRLLSLDANRGPAAARNFGLREAACRHVLLIDNDVQLLPGCLETLWRHVAARPSVAIVQARSLLQRESGTIHYDGGRFHFLGLIALRNWYRPLWEADDPGLVTTDVAISLCCLADRDALLEVGGFDEEMFILFEDLALCYALKLRGKEVAVATDARCLHGSGTAGLSTRGERRSYAARRTFLHSRNRWIFLLTHYQWRTLALLAPAFLLYGVVHLAFAVVSGHLGAWVQGKFALYRLRRHLRQRRALLQPLRVRRDRDLLGCPALTFNPGLAKGAVRGVVRRALDGGLRLYHRCVGWLL